MTGPDSTTNKATSLFRADYEVTAWYDADNAVAAREAVETSVRLDLPGLVDSTIDEWRFSHAKPENVYSARLQLTVRFTAQDETGARRIAEQDAVVSMPGLLSETVTLRGLQPE